MCADGQHTCTEGQQIRSDRPIMCANGLLMRIKVWSKGAGVLPQPGVTLSEHVC